MKEIVADQAPLEPAVGDQGVHQHREQQQQHGRAHPLTRAARGDQARGEQLRVVVALHKGPFRFWDRPAPGRRAVTAFFLVRRRHEGR